MEHNCFDFNYFEGETSLDILQKYFCSCTGKCSTKNCNCISYNLECCAVCTCTPKNCKNVKDDFIEDNEISLLDGNPVAVDENFQIIDNENDANKGVLPDNKTLSVEFGKMNELKKYMKRVMPFVQATRDKIEQLGVKALALTLEFDEAAVLKTNSAYLAYTLDLEEVIIKYTDDPEATDKMKECCPGSPFVLFSAKPGIKLEFINPVPQNGLFSKVLTVSDGDTYEKVVQRLAKDSKAMKKPESIQLWRFEDPVLGPTKIPAFNEPTKNKIQVSPDSVFKIDESKLKLLLGKETVDVGSQITYLVV
ncbi:unnamed protein product [Diabrotica balteata]|uniref:CRC domain-containing protein n=1 Tax=Diabrotica balteata TaxID=107213 RepID=A0A9N9T184_DIABA|nr:unnamed protein product [Diabrotica balteata]